MNKTQPHIDLQNAANINSFTFKESPDSKPTTHDPEVNPYEQTLAGHINIKDCSVDPHERYTKNATYLVLSVVTISAILFILSSPLATNIFFPAEVQISQALSIPVQTVSLSITTYILAQSVAPCFWGPISDHFGRRMALIGSLCICTCANIGLALVRNGPMLLAFRFVQALGSSSTISIGQGVITDIAPSSRRGSMNGIFSGSRQIFVALGPVLGGLIGEASGFRAIFWFLFAFSITATCVVVLFLPETHHSISWDNSLFRQRLRYHALMPIARQIVQDRNAGDVEKSISKPTMTKPFSLKIFLYPISLLFQKDAACALILGACTYTTWSMSMASLSQLLSTLYGFNTLQIGACYLPNGLGCVAGSVLSGKKLNETYRRESFIFQNSTRPTPAVSAISTPLASVMAPIPRKAIPTDFPLEQTRLSEAFQHGFIMIFGLLVYGWSLTPQNDSAALNVSFIVALLGQFCIGFGSTAVLNSNITLLQDLYPTKGASVGAASNFTRGLPAAGGVAAVLPLVDAIGPGFTSVVCVGSVLLGMIPLKLTLIWGQKWRGERERKNSVASSEKP